MMTSEKCYASWEVFFSAPAFVLAFFMLCMNLAQSLSLNNQTAGTAGLRRTSDVAEIVLGAYGPITSISTTFLSTAVAFELDFRKNFDSELVERFGPPVVTIPNLNSKLRIKLQIGTSNSDPEFGVSTALDFFLGRNGMTPVAGIVGGYHSAISMPVGSLSAVLKIPQVSWGSTSPKLSNKAQYPYFCRTIPPDSIQGAGMWQFIVHWEVPAVTFLYANEPYGEGLFTTVNNLASAAGQGYRITGIGVEYMPQEYDLEEARKKILMAKAAANKIIFLGFTIDQTGPLAYVLEQEGMLQSPWQLVGSEAVKVGSSGPRPANGFPIGFLRFNPVSQGPLFPKFAEMWTKMKADDVIGTAAVDLYSLDKMKVAVDAGKAPAPTDAMFSSASNLELEDPFMFDACYTFAVAFNEMLNSGVAAVDVGGEELLDKVKNINFEGISGTVAFNSEGDRLASYTIDNIQPDPNSQDAKVLVTIAQYNAATSQITKQTGTKIYWMGGMTSDTVPDIFIACEPGYFSEPVSKLCRQCESGSFSLGGAVSQCTRCAGGTIANAKFGATECAECAAGSSSDPGSIVCTACDTGRFANSTGMAECEACPTGKYQDETGQTSCKFREIVLGFYGPITSISTTFLVTAVAFELDFRKNFDPSLVERFGPPIIKIPDLNPNLRIKLQIGNSNSEPDAGVGTCLDMFLGQNGFDKVSGLVGGYHSAICMPVASLAAELKMVQVSWGCTSPKLSNKGVYPYFSRTMPPDSIQGAGMWQFIAFFEVPAVTFMYASEPYGEGLFATVNNMAAAANQAFRVSGIGINYMPGADYDLEEAQKKVNQAKALGNKFIFLGMTPDQFTPLAYVMEQNGMFTNKWQLIGSEAVKVGDYSPRPPDGLPVGFIRFNPISRGSLFPGFEDLWKELTPEDVIGDGAVKRYTLDNFKTPLSEGKAPMPDDAMFSSLDKVQLEDPFIFDAAYSMAISFNQMLNDNVEPQSIGGQALLDKVRALNFEGITGYVSFNEEGDRLASYTLDNIQGASSDSNQTDGRRLSTENLVVVGEFSAATSKITFSSGKTLQWMDGSVGNTIPSSLIACDKGFYQDASRLCRQCESGTFSLGGAGAKCQRCPKGTRADSPTMATTCESCPAGTYASETGLTYCTDCPAGQISVEESATACYKCPEGHFVSEPGQTECHACVEGTFSAAKGGTLCKNCSLGFIAPQINSTMCLTCPMGTYQDDVGMTACISCPPSQNTEVRGAQGIFECKCVPGTYRENADSPCDTCPKGMTCGYGSDMSLYWTWQQSGRPVTGVENGDFPRLDPHHSSLASDPLSVYWCRDENRCPGGPPGECGPRLDLEIISCSACEDEWYWDGEKCRQCSSFEVSSVLFPILPLMLGPIVVCLVYWFFRDDLEKWGSWQNGAAALCFILLNHYQITTLASNTNVQYPKDAADFFHSWAFSDDLMSIFKPQCAGFASFEKTMIIRTVGPIVMAVVFVIVFICSKLINRYCGMPWGMDLDRALNIYFSIILTFFAGIVSMCIMIFKCHDNPNGKRTLSKDEGIVCGEDTWNKMLGVAIASIFLYIIGFGALFTWAIIVGPQRFGDLKFQRRWKFLFIKYRPDVWWWTIAFCCKGVLMNLGFVFLDKGISQLNWIMGISGLYCCLSIYYMPWRHRGANIVEIYAHVGLMFVISLFGWYAHDAVEDPEAIGRQISKVAIVINLSPMVLAIPIFLWFVHTQTTSSYQGKFLKEASSMYTCLSVLTQSGEQRVISFMQSLHDWDRFYMMQACQVMKVEFPVTDNLSRGNSGKRLTATSPQNSPSKIPSTLPGTEAQSSSLPQVAESVMDQKPFLPQLSKGSEASLDPLDFQIESHGTPRSGRAARPVCMARTPPATPREAQTPRDLGTPRDAMTPR